MSGCRMDVASTSTSTLPSAALDLLRKLIGAQPRQRETVRLRFLVPPSGSSPRLSRSEIVHRLCASSDPASPPIAPGPPYTARYPLPKIR
jgi:hypothetical protein